MSTEDGSHLFEEFLAEVRLSGCPQVEVLQEPDFDSYYEAMNALLARTDVLWTKPSELTFYAALGLPIVRAMSPL